MRQRATTGDGVRLHWWIVRGLRWAPPWAGPSDSVRSRAARPPIRSSTDEYVASVKRVLLTGMSGVGKSTVVDALVALGFEAVDTDYGFCATAADGERIWDERRIRELLATEDAEVLFVAGCVSNQAKFYSQFDLVILLSAPVAVMIERIRTRTDNPFGKTARELSNVLSDLEVVEPLLRKGASAEIRTDRPLDEVLEDVLRLTRSHDPEIGAAGL